MELIFNNENNLIYSEDPLNPLNLPAYTIRLLYKDGVTPSFTKGTAVQVSSSPNIWDLTYMNSDWTGLLQAHENLLEVLGANSSGVTTMAQMLFGCYSLYRVSLFDTSNVTDMRSMFSDFSPAHGNNLTSVPLFDTSNVTNMYWMFGCCTKLTSVPLFDTSNVTNMYHMFSDCSELPSVPLFDTSSVTSMDSMFENCSQLSSVPLFDTSSVTNMNYMLYNCYNVESGALALYQQASTQVNPPTNHIQAFKDCGRDTVTGAAELAQIPDDWK